jgi:hypothetical protein
MWASEGRSKFFLRIKGAKNIFLKGNKKYVFQNVFDLNFQNIPKFFQHFGGPSGEILPPSLTFIGGGVVTLAVSSLRTKSLAI